MMVGQIFTLLLVALASGDDPSWLPKFPIGGVTAASSPENVIDYFKNELKRAGIDFSANFDGMGTAIKADDGKTSCLISVRENDGGSRVKQGCAPREEPTGASVFISTPTPAVAP